MEEQKYYTPAPEDLRVGFDLEVLTRPFARRTSKWNKYILSEKDDFKVAVDLITAGDIRVPYLTAEQIEDEGWVKQINPAYFVTERNGFKYQLTSFHDEAQAQEVNCPRCHVIIRINPDPWIIDHFQVFRGTIRCINDLRLISKLLGI